VKFITSFSDVPDEVGDDIYIVGFKKKAKWVIFDCPCSKGHKLTVNLMESHYPYWKLKFYRNQVSLSPSIRVSDHACRSHFWLQSNRAYLVLIK